MRRIILILCCLLLPIIGQAQLSMSRSWRDYLEMLSEEGEDGVAEDLMDLYDAFSDNPVNLNDTVHILQEFPFINDIQRAFLRSYQMLYGELMSVEELYSINGFDSVTVELLRPLTRCGHHDTWTPLRLSDVLKYGRSNWVTGVGGTVEKARGYREDIYEGDNLRLMWRYTFKYKDRVQLQLSGDKDPGEAFFRGSQRQGFDFYGYSLMLNDVGRNAYSSVYLKRVIVGQYHAQFGQGLTAWSGFGYRMSMGTGINRYAPGIRPNGVFTEYGYLQGVAAEVSLFQKWSMTLFGSYVNRDATLPRNADKDSTIDWVQSIYGSGYHRTQTEIKKQSQLEETLLGAHLGFTSEHWKLGVTAMGTFLGKEIIPATYIYNDNVFKGDRNFNTGLDAVYRRGRLLLFGEAAICSNHAFDSIALNVSPAAVVGGEFVFNNDHRMSAQVHYYSPTYHNLHACAIGQGSNPQNEAGAGLYYQGQLPGRVMVSALAECAYYPHEKYLVYAPSYGKGANVVLSRPIGGGKDLLLSVRYRYKDKGRNITPSRMENGQYLIEQTYRHQIQTDIEYNSGPWRLVTRLGWAHYHGNVTEAVSGLLLYQDVQFRPHRLPIMVAARVALFDVDDYEARLYAVESDFVYQYNSAIYQNEGCRFYLLMKYDINESWNIGVKYAITSYADKDEFGSGYDLIDANHRQQWKVQLRLKW